MSTLKYLHQRLVGNTPKKQAPKRENTSSPQLCLKQLDESSYVKIFHHEVEQNSITEENENSMDVPMLDNQNNSLLANQANCNSDEYQRDHVLTMSVNSMLERTFNPKEVEFVQHLAKLVCILKEEFGEDATLTLQQAFGGFPRSSTPASLLELQRLVVKLKMKLPGKLENRKPKKLLSRYNQFGVILLETLKHGWAIDLSPEAIESCKNGSFLHHLQSAKRTLSDEEISKTAEKKARICGKPNNLNISLQPSIFKARRILPTGNKVVAETCSSHTHPTKKNPVFIFGIDSVQNQSKSDDEGDCAHENSYLSSEGYEIINHFDV